MSNADTVKVLAFADRAAVANFGHWMDYRALVRRALPHGLNQQQELMVRCAFDKAWEAARQEGFESGIAFSRSAYGTPGAEPQPEPPKSPNGGAKPPDHPKPNG
jgi:hypothetical protein